MHRCLSSRPTVVRHCRAGIPPAIGQFSLRNLTIQAFFGIFANIVKNSRWSNHLHITCRSVLTMTVGLESYLPTSISPWEMVGGLAIRWQAQLLIDGSLVALHILLLDHYAAGCEASCHCHVSFTLKGIQILAVLVFTTERLANPQIMWQRTVQKIIESSSKQQKKQQLQQHPRPMIIHDILQYTVFSKSSLSPGPPKRHVGTHPDSDLFVRQNVWNGER